MSLYDVVSSNKIVYNLLIKSFVQQLSKSFLVLLRTGSSWDKGGLQTTSHRLLWPVQNTSQLLTFSNSASERPTWCDISYSLHFQPSSLPPGSYKTLERANILRCVPLFFCYQLIEVPKLHIYNAPINVKLLGGRPGIGGDLTVVIVP